MFLNSRSDNDGQIMPAKLFNIIEKQPAEKMLTIHIDGLKIMTNT